MIPELEAGLDIEAMIEFEKERKWLRPEKPLEVTIWKPSRAFLLWFYSHRNV